MQLCSFVPIGLTRSVVDYIYCTNACNVEICVQSNGPLIWCKNCNNMNLLMLQKKRQSKIRKIYWSWIKIRTNLKIIFYLQLYGTVVNLRKTLQYQWALHSVYIFVGKEAWSLIQIQDCRKSWNKMQCKPSWIYQLRIVFGYLNLTLYLR